MPYRVTWFFVLRRNKNRITHNHAQEENNVKTEGEDRGPRQIALLLLQYSNTRR